MYEEDTILCPRCHQDGLFCSQIVKEFYTFSVSEGCVFPDEFLDGDVIDGLFVECSECGYVWNETTLFLDEYNRTVRPLLDNDRSIE